MYLQCSGTRAIQGTATTARCCAKAGREGWRKKSHNPAAGATVGKSTKRAGTQDSNVLREEEESRATYPMAKPLVCDNLWLTRYLLVAIFILSPHDSPNSYLHFYISV